MKIDNVVLWQYVPTTIKTVIIVRSYCDKRFTPELCRFFVIIVITILYCFAKFDGDAARRYATKTTTTDPDFPAKRTHNIVFDRFAPLVSIVCVNWIFLNGTSVWTYYSFYARHLSGRIRVRFVTRKTNNIYKHISAILLFTYWFRFGVGSKTFCIILKRWWDGKFSV